MKRFKALSAILVAGLLASVAHAAATLTTLYSFSGPDGANPVGGLVQGADGNFYGTTSDNDFTSQFGTVFRMTPEGAFTNLYSFLGGDDGAWPQAGLAQDGVGNLYGKTYRRGAIGWGTVFKITPSGDFTTVVSFDSFPGDASSLLVQASDGNFYGATSGG